jgi:hypothetical protein
MSNPPWARTAFMITWFRLESRGLPSVAKMPKVRCQIDHNTTVILSNAPPRARLRYVHLYIRIAFGSIFTQIVGVETMDPPP